MHDFGMHNIALTQPALRRGLHDHILSWLYMYKEGSLWDKVIK